jgi:broad specificity phosphatase PhoE
VRLGEYFASRGISFDAVYAGTLRRHSQTLVSIRTGLGLQGDSLPAAKLDAGLNEYDSDAVIRAIATPAQIAAMQSPTSGEGYKQHFVMLRKGITAWMLGQSQPEGMPSYAQFAAGVMAVLDEIRASEARTVLVSSSGGPLSSAVAQVLGLDHVAGIELNMRMRNTAVSELIVTPKRLALLTFNTLPHLDYPMADDAAGRVMQTYA